MSADTDPKPDDHDDYKDIHRQNMIALIFVTVLIFLGIWLVEGFRKHIKLEECVEAHRHDCGAIDAE